MVCTGVQDPSSWFSTCVKCDHVHHSGYPCVRKICVITTPEGENAEVVRMVSLKNDKMVKADQGLANISGYRPITDCSRPFLSVNDYMLATAPKFTFSSINDTRALSEGSFGAVIDISNAYRNILIYPPHRRFMGIKWEVNNEVLYYVDNALCFGLRSAPAIFNSVTKFIPSFMYVMGLKVVGYLDDYFLAGNTAAECTFWQSYLINFLNFLGFKVNYDKVIPPSRTPRYLGIVLDLENMMFCLPEDKLCRAESAVNKLLSKKWVSSYPLYRY